MNIPTHKVGFFISHDIYIKQKIMKHILNNLSEEEKNSIREQHTGGMKVMTENFSKLLNSKLGDAKPLFEQTDLDYKSLASRLEKAMKGMGTDNDEVFAVLHNIDTKEQFNNLVKAFGIRDGQNLNQWIAGDIWSGYEWNKNIVPFYQRIGLPVPPVNANVANAVNKIGNTIKGAFNEQMGMEDDFEGSENMEDDFEGVEEVSHMSFLLQNADKNTATNLLKKYMAKHSQTVNFVAVLRCEGVDLTDINFCECPNLLMVNLRETPNNFEETQGNCAHNMRGGLWDFDMGGEKPSVNEQTGNRDPQRITYFDNLASQISSKIVGKTFPFGKIGVLDNTSIKIESYDDRNQSINLAGKPVTELNLFFKIKRIQEDLYQGEKPGTRVWRGELEITANFINGKISPNPKVELWGIKNGEIDFSISAMRPSKPWTWDMVGGADLWSKAANPPR